jgi:transcriptional regulator with XRE-family HTH domain
MTRDAGTAATPFDAAAEVDRVADVAAAGPPVNSELGDFLRRMRERASPQALGLSVSRRRRAPGLLREEVAQAAGISATWYTWLEQGRRVRASVEVLDALAQALQLDTTERGHLLALARPDLQSSFTNPADASGVALARWVASLPQPAYAFDENWDLRCFNSAADRLFGPFDLADPMGRNLLRRIFLDTRWQSLFEDWDGIARASLGQYRNFNATRLQSPAVAAMVAELSRRSPRFAALWAERPLAPPALRQKLVRHPQHGLLAFEFVVLRPEAAEAGVRVSLYSAADAHTAAVLAAL